MSQFTSAASSTETLAALCGGDGLAGALNALDTKFSSLTLSDISDVTASITELNYIDGVTSAIQTQLDAKQATITGGATTIDTEDLTASRALVSTAGGKVAVATTTATEIGYVNGVTSAIQTQLNAKQATITGGATTIDTEDLTASRALVSSASGKVEVATTTATEIGYVNGVTSSIQTQITNLVRKAMINSTTNGAYSFGGTNYIYPCAVGDPNATETNRQSTFPACTLKKLYFNVTANTLNNNLVVTVRDDAAGTSLTKTVATTVTGVQSVAADVSVADESQISIQIVTTAAGSGSATIANMTLVYEITS